MHPRGCLSPLYQPSRLKQLCPPVQEMFIRLGKALDRELDEIVPMLLKKAGEVSNAGVVWTAGEGWGGVERCGVWTGMSSMTL